jgi:hypothetical protein
MKAQRHRPKVGALAAAPRPRPILVPSLCNECAGDGRTQLRAPWPDTTCRAIRLAPRIRRQWAAVIAAPLRRPRSSRDLRDRVWKQSSLRGGARTLPMPRIRWRPRSEQRLTRLRCPPSEPMRPRRSPGGAVDPAQPSHSTSTATNRKRLPIARARHRAKCAPANSALPIQYRPRLRRSKHGLWDFRTKGRRQDAPPGGIGRSSRIGRQGPAPL